MAMTPDDKQALAEAVAALEEPGLVAQISNLVGGPIEQSMKRLPESVSQKITKTVESALKSSLQVGVRTLGDRRAGRPSNRMHKALSTLTGAVGGAFGLPALAIELPVSTTVMLRSIADIARSEGEDLSTPESQMACIEVFALGSGRASDEGTETIYYATRTALSKAVTDAAKYVAEKGLVEEGAPAIMRLITKIAGHFSLPVTQKFAAQSIPAIGAAGGAAVNLVFLSHYQEMARGHFTVRRLERKYGEDVVQAEYRRLSRRL